MSEETPAPVGSWNERHEIIKIIKFQDKTFGWIHVIVGKRKKDGELVIRLKRFRNWFTIPSERCFLVVKHMLESGAQEIGWTGEISDKKIQKLIDERELLIKQKQKSAGQIIRYKEIVNRLVEQSAFLREEQLTFKLEIFKKDLRDFSNKLSKGSGEKEIQDWLFYHTWVFGPIYVDQSQEVIDREGDRIDFFLRRYDTFYDIFEFKLPTCKVFVGKTEDVPEQKLSREFRPSADVKDALSQIIGYLETFEIDKTNIYWEKKIAIHKPRGIIVIGRKQEGTTRALKTLNSYLHDIEILTYDDVLEMGKNLIRIIEERGKGKPG